MLSVKNLMNPNIKEKKSHMSIPMNQSLANIDGESLIKEHSDYINVIDNKQKVVGAIKRERLCYLHEKKQDIQFVEILDALDVGIVGIDQDSRIFYVNCAYANILGVKIAKVLGRYMNIIEPTAALIKVLKTGKPEKLENQHIKSVDAYVSTKMFPIKNGDNIIGAFSIFTDVTQINMYKKEVKRISDVADEYNRQIEERQVLVKNSVIGKSKVYLECIAKTTKASHTDATVLLLGENGVGKEIMARIIRDNSDRKNNAFITVNCSAIPEFLIESELFGYEEGSFTGASRGGKIGKFQLADKGTLFLDEIGDMPLHMQAKLLRVLQDGEIEKIGRQNNIPVDVRVIAATNKHLEEMVKKGEFREDLYYRLNVISITIPPLRERGNDVILLEKYFLKKYNERYKKDVVLDNWVYQRSLEYNWPGNIRELKNAIESAVIMCDGKTITAQDLPEKMTLILEKESMKNYDSINSKVVSRGTLKERVEDFEKKVILETLNQNEGDKEETMKVLGLAKRTFYRKIAKNGTKK